MHYSCILLTGSISLKLGFVTQNSVESQNPETIDPHPNDSDTLTMFAFVKQQFYHKSLAFSKYEEQKKIREANGGRHKFC